MLNRWTEILSQCRHKISRHWYHIIEKTRTDFPSKVSPKRFIQNCCFQESGWFLFPSSSPHHWTNIPWKHFVKIVMSCHIMQKIPWYCKFNVLFIWLKITAVSAENFKFQTSCFFVWKPLLYYNALSLSTIYKTLVMEKIHWWYLLYLDRLREKRKQVSKGP